MAGSESQTGAGTRFGKFLLLKKLASGGMGEIFLAKQTGLVGFEKILVIKRILQHHLNNKNYVDMFFSEARIAAMLSHSNVIQVYDMGEVDEHFYIAMEYVHGRSLKEVLARSTNNNSPIPLPYVADIISQACAGLSYSHNLNDAADQPLNVIHRDINPHNLLLSYNGEVKIIDFGIAKSTMQIVKTEAGTIKGKFIYMSPEQSAAEPLDKRSDIFSLSIVLYELLSGYNPFQRDNIVLSLEAIQRREPRPITEVRPEAEAFVEVLRRGLAKEPGDRYGDCAEMREDLQRLLQENILEREPRPINEWLEELFADRIEEDRQILLETGSGVSQAKVRDRSQLAVSDSTEAISVAAKDEDSQASSSEPTAGLDSGEVKEAIGDVFSSSQPGASPLLGRGTGPESAYPEEEQTRRELIPASTLEQEVTAGLSVDEATVGIGSDEATVGVGRGAADLSDEDSEVTAAFTPPPRDVEETKAYERPATPVSDILAVPLDQPVAPRRNTTALAAGGVVALLAAIGIIALVAGDGGAEAQHGVDEAGAGQPAVVGRDALVGAGDRADTAAVAMVERDAAVVEKLDAASAAREDLDAASETVEQAQLPDAARAAPDRRRPAAVADAATSRRRRDAGRAGTTNEGSNRRQVRRNHGTLIVNPGTGNTVSYAGKTGVGNRSFTLRSDRGRFTVNAGGLRVSADFRIVGESLRLKVDSKPWAILSDGGISLGRTPQNPRAKRRFSLEFRSPRLGEPVKVIVIFQPG